MTSRVLPGLGLHGFWDLGEDLWKDQHDYNLLALSVVASGGVTSATTALPGSPTNGDVYIVPSGGDATKVAIRDLGAWVYLVPQEGLSLYAKDTNTLLIFDGAAWAPVFTERGTNLTHGSATPTGGEDGDYYIESDTGDIWKRAAGVWAVVLHAPIAAYLIGYAPGVPSAAQVMAQIVIAKAQQLPAGAADSQGYVGVNATASTVFDIKKNGVSVGSMTFTSGGPTAAFTVASAVSFAPGDILTIQAPVSPDATLADLSFNFKVLGI